MDTIRILIADDHLFYRNPISAMTPRRHATTPSVCVSAYLPPHVGDRPIDSWCYAQKRHAVVLRARAPRQSA